MHRVPSISQGCNEEKSKHNSTSAKRTPFQDLIYKATEGKEEGNVCLEAVSENTI